MLLLQSTEVYDNTGPKDTIPHFTTTLVVISRERLKETLVLYLHCISLHDTHVYVGPCQCDQLRAKDADMVKALLPLDITTKVLVR